MDEITLSFINGQRRQGFDQFMALSPFQREEFLDDCAQPLILKYIIARLLEDK